MIPSQKGLDSGDGTAAEIHLGLVMQQELVTLQSPSQVTL
jgi:hypothetical protein